MKASITLAIGIGIAVTSAAQAQLNIPGVNPAQYQCYRVSEVQPISPVQATVIDQFGVSRNSRIGKAVFLCTPVSMNSEDIKDKVTHLTCYQLLAKNVDSRVKVTNRFGSQELKVGETNVLCVPTLKEVLK